MTSILFIFALIFHYFFNWSIIALQWCTSFCYRTNRISSMHTYPLPPEPPSHPILFPPSRSLQSTELSSLCYSAASQELSVSHMVVCIRHAVLSTRPPLPGPYCKISTSSFYFLTPRALHRHPSPLFLSFSASFSRLLIPTSNTYMTLGKSLCLSEALIPHLKMAVIIAGWLTSQSLRDDSIEIING